MLQSGLRIKVNNFGDVAFLLYLCASFSHCSGKGFDHYFTLISFGMVVIYILLAAVKQKLVFDSYCCYVVIYVVMLYASYLWAEWPEYVFSSYSNLLNDSIQFLLFSIFVANRVRNREDIERLLKIFMFSVFYMLLSIIIRTPVSYYSINSVSGGRIGTVTGLWVTTVAVIYSIGLAIFFYFQKDKAYRSVIARVIALIAVLYLLLTGSKQGVLLILAFLTIYIVFNHSSNILKKLGMIMVVLIGVVGIYKTIMNVDQLYESFGYRLEEFVNGMLYGDTDSSTNTRMELMGMAWGMFLERPILGWGFYNVTAYVASIGYFIITYAHSAYLETAADLGLVGLIIIYSMHAFILRRFWKRRRRMDKLDITLCTLVAALLILDIMNVSYMWISIYFIIQMAYLANKFVSYKEV